MTHRRHEVVIVGAGIIGLAIAIHLQARGHEVVLIDRKGIAGEASGGNAGALAFSDILPLASPGMLRQAPQWLLDPLGPLTIRPAYALKILPWLLRFGYASRPSQWRASCHAQTALMALAKPEFHVMLARVHGSHMIRRDGSLQLYEGQAQFEASRLGWDVRAAAGIAFEHVRGSRLADLQPGLADTITAATFVPQWETVDDPLAVAQKLGNHLLDHGARLLIDEVVTIAPQTATGVRIGLRSGGTIEADQGVIAAGAWSHQLAAQLGDRIPLETERGYNTTLPGNSFDLRRQLIFGVHGFVATPLTSGIRIGGAVELAGLELAPDMRRAQTMLTTAKRLLPQLEIKDGTQWMGFRPSLPDSLPVIDRSRASERCHYAFGHGHLGLTQSAATGRLVAELLERESPALDLSPFRASRFW